MRVFIAGVTNGVIFLVTASEPYRSLESFLVGRESDESGTFMTPYNVRTPKDGKYKFKFRYFPFGEQEVKDGKSVRGSFNL